MIQQLRRVFGLLAIGIFIGHASSTRADMLFLRETIPVYDSIQANRQVINHLQSGERAQVSSGSRNGFRRVLLIRGTQTIEGFVLNRDFKLSRVRAETTNQQLKEELKYTKAYSRKKVLGLGYNYSKLSQEARSIETADEVSYSIGAVTSTTYFIVGFFDLPLGGFDSKWMLRTSLSLRETKFTGKSHASYSLTEDKIEMEQTFWGLGLSLKYYPMTYSKYWFEGGLEMNNGRDVKLNIGGSEQDMGGDKPFYAFTFLGVGLDIALLAHFYLVPELRFGAMVNTDPRTMAMEASLSLACSL